MEMQLRRRSSIRTLRGVTTFGRWYIQERSFCLTLEDELRADPDPSTPVNEGKVYGATAFPAGRYELRFRKSPKFGDETIEIIGVPGYTDTLVHSGVDVESTLGCVIVGDLINETDGTISGGKLRGVLERLKDYLRTAFRRNERVWLTVFDPEATVPETA